MTILEAIILGMVQGFTEFIPVSSSGHVLLLQSIMNNDVDHLFLEYINIGTVLALLIYFWPKIAAITKDIVINHDWRLAINLLISALPAGIIGFMLAGFIETNWFFSNVWVVIIGLVVVGAVFIVLEKLPKMSHLDSNKKLTKSRALTIGIVQTLALIPGVSRSGSTIVAGRLVGLNIASAAEYSFLLSIPIMLGVVAKLAIVTSDRQYLFDNFAVVLSANVAAFVCGLIAVSVLMKYLAKNSLAIFGWYRIALALAFLLWQLF